MEWSSPSLILNTRLYGEADGIATVLSLEQGKYRGLVKGMSSRKQASLWQIGNFISATWSARLSDQLGYFKAELIRPNFIYLSSSRLAFTVMTSLCAVIEGGLLERQPVEEITQNSFQLINILSDASGDIERKILVLLLRWELFFLTDLGYGLDFSICQQMGEDYSSYWVSPKTGKIVTETMAGEWKPRLFRLPSLFLKENEYGNEQDWYDGLKMTGYFLQKNIFSVLNKPLPQARIYLLEYIQKQLKQ